MRLMNARTDCVLAEKVEMAQSRAERKKGLLGRSGLPEGAALVIVPCFSIHTFGMRFPIDVIFVDAHGRVKKIVRDLGPSRMSASLSSRAVVEMPAGALSDAGLAVGDRLYVELQPKEAPPPMTWESVSPVAG